MRIAVDAGGADLGPAEVAAGAAIAASAGVTPVLFGLLLYLGVTASRDEDVARARIHPHISKWEYSMV